MIAKLGNFDFSSYIKVAKDQGMDPVPGGFFDKVISHSVLAEGGVLSAEDAKPTERIYPLALHAANRDALSALVRQLNLACDASGQTFTWQDAGSSNPTYWDQIAAKFEPQYSYREGEQFWLQGKLTVTTMPYGRIATAPRVVATAAGTGPVLTLSVPSVAGDVPAKLSVTIKAGIAPGLAYPMYAVAVVPTGYQALFSGPSQLAAHPNQPAATTFRTGSGAIASTFIRWATTVANSQVLEQFQAVVATPAMYAGRTRVLALLRAPAAATAIVRLESPRSDITITSPATTVRTALTRFEPVTSFITATDWQVIDVGVMTIPTNVAVPGPIAVPVMVSGTPATTYNASQIIVDAAGIILLPDNGGAGVKSSDSPGLASILAFAAGDGASRTAMTFNGINGNRSLLSYDNATNSIAESTGVTRGKTPLAPVASAFQIVAVAAPAGVTAWNHNTQVISACGPMNDVLDVTVTAQERTRFTY